MDQRTREHIQLAERNRDLARALLAPAVANGLRPPPYEWIAVIAFYSAVHYVNAYLWETRQYEPGNHQDRKRSVRSDGTLRRCRLQYERLFDAGIQARYARGYSLSPQLAHGLVNTDLANVEAVVMAAI